MEPGGVWLPGRFQPLAGVITLTLVGFLGSPLAHAEENTFSFSRLELNQESGAPEKTEGWSFPDYMQNWEFGINIGIERTPLYFADLIFPLYRPDAEDRVLFFEPRVNHLQSETLFNAGVGYRQLFRDRTWMLGGNLFYDYDTNTSHYRVGTGAEAISSYAELRANGYLGLSLTREIDPGVPQSQSIVERAVDGYDVEVGAPLPFYSRLKLFGGYEWYDFKKFKNREGWSVRAEYKPVPFAVLDVTFGDNTKRNSGWIMNLALKPPIWENEWKRIESPLQLDPRMFPDADVGGRLLTLVERHHEMVVEKYTSGSGVTVEVGRRN